MKTFLKYPLLALGILVAAALTFFIISIVLEFRPEERMQAEIIHTPSDSVSAASGAIPSSVLPDTLKILSWNIGYAGLGDNMDFFMDGGVKVRDSEQRTIRNLTDIITLLQAADADIYLLQEVDKKAHRTYGTDEVAAISAAFPDYYACYAPNFKVWFVPSPLREPIGQVNSGLLILSRNRPISAERIQYPSAFPFPISLFNLKRCLLSATFTAPDGSLFTVGNTHCTAFDTGSMRSEEISFLKKYLSDIDSIGNRFIIGGDWNQYPPQYTPTPEELSNRFFIPEKLDTAGMCGYAKVVCDTTRPSMRFNDAPLSPNSLKTLLDFFVTSKDIQDCSVAVVNLGFGPSDHNPVIATFCLSQ